MEFRDEVLQCKLLLRNLELLGIRFNPLEQLDGPTTGNIVRNLDDLDLLVFYSGQKDVVHIDEPSNSQSDTMEHHGKNAKTYFSPFCKSTTPFLRTRP